MSVRYYNFREGDRSEYLAQFLLSELGICSPVPRQEDVGFDFHCSIFREEPMRPHGNTIKQLNESKKGLWRYRIGDFRLIYFPDQKEKMVILMAFGPRSGIYN